MSNLSIKKYISNVITILTYFKYFLNYLQLYLTRIRKTKAVFIEDDFVRLAFVKETFRWNIYMDAKLSVINYWLSKK